MRPEPSGYVAGVLPVYRDIWWQALSLRLVLPESWLVNGSQVDRELIIQGLLVSPHGSLR
jgi:hypothetical protein